MSEEPKLRLYRLSGLLRFVDKGYVAADREEAEKVLDRVSVIFDEGRIDGTVELIERNVEDLGPYREDNEASRAGQASETPEANEQP